MIIVTANVGLLHFEVGERRAYITGKMVGFFNSAVAQLNLRHNKRRSGRFRRSLAPAALLIEDYFACVRFLSEYFFDSGTAWKRPQEA